LALRFDEQSSVSRRTPTIDRESEREQPMSDSMATSSVRDANGYFYTKSGETFWLGAILAYCFSHTAHHRARKEKELKNKSEKPSKRNIVMTTFSPNAGKNFNFCFENVF
jgi:hypothetical protein